MTTRELSLKYCALTSFFSLTVGASDISPPFVLDAPILCELQQQKKSNGFLLEKLG